MMKAEDYLTTTTELAGWKVRVTSYRVGESYYCIVDNVEPGAWIARASGATRKESETKAIEEARSRLAETRRLDTA